MCSARLSIRYMWPLIAFTIAGCNDQAVLSSNNAAYFKDECGGASVWSVRGAESGELMTYYRVKVSPTAVLWSGVEVDTATLQKYLGQVRSLNPRPVTALVVTPQAKCDDVIKVRQAMEAQLHCSLEKDCVEYPEAEWIRRHPPVP